MQNKARALPGFTANPICVTDEFRQPDAPPVTKKVDLLFVVDNSESMNRHWQLMADKIEHLIRELPANQDMRFAVILGSIKKNTGVLFSAPGVAKVLDGKKMTPAQVSAALSKTFAEAMKDKYVDWKGAGEALVYSTYFAATKHSKEIQAQGFFRADAALDIIFMSDDADESYPYPKKQFWDLPRKCNWSHHEEMRRSYHVPRGIDVDSTFSALKQLKGDQPLITNAFVNITRADILVDNKLTDRCIYDSPGLGFFQIVKKTNGVLYSIHGNRAEGLSRAGRLLAERLELMHDFTLSKPANLVDPASIEVTVDGAKVAHTYNAATGVVHVENAGSARSLVSIHHCEPTPATVWEISGFAGTASRTSANLGWSTGDAVTDGKVLYGTDPAVLNDEAVDSGRARTHELSISGLSPNTNYFFQAVSKDETGLEKRSEVISLRTQPDWAITDLSGQASRETASVSWKTPAYPTFARVAWGTSANNLNNTTFETGQGSDHMFVITGLSASTTYYFQAISRDEFGLEKRGEVLRLKTVNEWDVIGFAGSATRTTVSLSWQTPEYPTDSIVRYGTESNALNNVAEGGPRGIPHAAQITGLQPGTKYYFRAEAKDDIGKFKTSDLISVTTVSDWTLGELTLAATETSFTASFTTSGYPTAGQIIWGSSPDNLGGAVDAGAGDSHLATVSNLTPDTDYYVQAIARDDLGVERRSAVQRVRTNPIPLPVWEITDLTSNATTSGITVGWNTTGYPTTGAVRYGKSPDALSNRVEECGSGTSHSVAFEGLEPDTVYYVQVLAADDRGQQQSSAVFAVRTQSIPLPEWTITNFAGDPAQTSVTLTWATAEYATIGKVDWGTSSGNLGNSVAETVAGKTHSLTVTGLTPDTDYFFRVTAADDRGQEKVSAVIRVRTEAIPLPVWEITNFSGTSTQVSVSLGWETSGYPTVGTLRWGTSAGNLNRTVTESSAGETHALEVTGLTADKDYFFQVTAKDDRGQSKSSAVIKVRTQAIPLPVWSITNFGGTAGQTSATLSWNTSDYATVGTVMWGTSSDNLDQTKPESQAGTSHSLSITGLTPDTTYYFRVAAVDDRGQTKTSEIISLRTDPIPLPIWDIAGFAGTPDVHSVALKWETAAYATKGKVRYGLSAANLDQESALEGTAAKAHSLTVSGLNAVTTYYFQVEAQDDRGQVKTSEVIAVTTTKADPTWTIVGFDGTTTATSATIIWQTGAPAKGLLEIGLSPTDFSVRKVTLPAYNTSQIITVQGLTPNTVYYFRATATDRDGGEVVSNVISKTTKASR